MDALPSNAASNMFDNDQNGDSTKGSNQKMAPQHKNDGTGNTPAAAAGTIGKAPLLQPTKEQAMEAVRTLIAWAGDDPNREGLIDTPDRVTRAYKEFFAGYEEDPVDVLSRTFEEVEGYSDMVMLRDIAMESHCEHHMVPILGKAHIAYIPTNRVVGISKLARVVEIYGKRLQTQETMTAQIGDAIQDALGAQGVAVLLEAKHQCMTTRGIRKSDVDTITWHFTGVFRDDPRLEQRFLDMAKGPR